MGASLVLVQPEGELRAVLGDLMIPALRPEPPVPVKQAARTTKTAKA
jgi:hypothetical protein